MRIMTIDTTLRDKCIADARETRHQLSVNRPRSDDPVLDCLRVWANWEDASYQPVDAMAVICLTLVSVILLIVL